MITVGKYEPYVNAMPGTYNNGTDVACICSIII